jgi:hypothetical protein
MMCSRRRAAFILLSGRTRARARARSGNSARARPMARSGRSETFGELPGGLIGHGHGRRYVTSSRLRSSGNGSSGFVLSGVESGSRGQAK